MTLEYFRDRALMQVPRILGLCNRNRESATFGCFDRYYWQYRLMDFPNGRFQEAVLLLVLLNGKDFPNNIYFGRDKMIEWAKGGVDFWFSKRNKDGSVYETYPYERSFCATSFSTYAITESLLIMGQEAPKSLENTANWLSKNNNIDVANQMAAAALALYNCYLLTGSDKYRNASQEKINILLRTQDETGYFPEYGGYDIGYLSITVSCLAKYYSKKEDMEVWQAIQKAINFLSGKIDEYGNYNIKGSSRRTQFLYPYGLVFMKSDIIDKLENGLKANRVIEPSWLDDRYVIQLTSDYIEASLSLLLESIPNKG